MSMLAERKIKQKWSLNPRGKVWSEDSNKFGQKLLEKMGWSKGKGLGAKEDGMTDHVKIPYKNDSKGIGYQDRNDQWTSHDTNFNALLQSLSGETPLEPRKFASLEEKSQNSRVRVHYKKFMKGKDLSKCSEKDLACIFGKKSINDKSEVKSEEETVGKEVLENNHRFTYNGSMVDYFKKKLPSYGKSAYVVGSNGVLKKDSDSEEELRVGFGFGEKRQAEEAMNGTPKKKKEENGISNPAFAPLYGSVHVQKRALRVIEEEEEQVEKESDSERMEINEKKSAGEMESVNCDDVLKCEQNTGSKMKKKKKKKNVTAIDNPNFNENEDNGQMNNVYEVKRKRKKDDDPSIDNFNIRNKKRGIENPNFNEDNRIVCQNESLTIDNLDLDIPNDYQGGHMENNFEVKREKKKKAKTAIDNPNFKENERIVHMNDAYEVKNKKKKNDSPLNENFEVRRKKRKRENGIENPTFDNDNQNDCQNMSSGIDNMNFDNSSDCQSSYVDRNFEVKRKKKKKDKMTIANPNFDETEEEKNPEPSLDLILNVTSTPTPSKPQKSPIKRRKIVRFSDVNEERIIPNEDDHEDEVRNRNELFDINSKIIENGLRHTPNLTLDEMSKKIDGFQAEIENDINEAKANNFIGEVGNPDGDNEKLVTGTMLKFKFANFGKSPNYHNKDASQAKKSYKHLIKGDIVLMFKNTNLHEIVGYGNGGRNKNH